MRKRGKNTFVTLISLLGVRFTESFSDKYFNEHPHKYNLYGLHNMLSDYKIPNAATKIEDKENDIFDIELPFVAHFGGDFVVVYKVESDKVHFIRNGKSLAIPVSQFIQMWSGIILVTKTSPDSGEPDYKEHRNKDILIYIQQLIIAIATLLILVIAYINNIYNCPTPHIILSEIEESHINPVFPYSVLGFTLLLAINLTGVFICYLLVLKQLHIQSRYADKICSLFNKSDCNNVLESDAAKLWGIFGWSEIGLGYFVANIIVLLFFPQLNAYLAIINILTLPFTVWSIWYQKAKAHHWCPLCLIVQILLWIIFLSNLRFGYIQPIVIVNMIHNLLESFNFQPILICCIFAISIFSLTLFIPKLSKGNQVENLRQEINSIKANEEVFRTLLTQQPFYEVSKMDSSIHFGNLDAKLVITILTNPFCNPCAKLHASIEKLLKETNNNVCIIYIFSAFNKSLEFANKSFIAIYLEKSKETSWRLYSDWFKIGKNIQEAFFNDLHLDMFNPAIESEFAKHQSWKEKTQLYATPAVLVNGYKLPDNYKIEDLCYLTKFDFDNR